MNHIEQITIAGLLSMLLAGPVALANEKPKKPATSPRQQVFAKYDLDKNGNLNVAESDTLRRDYENNPADPLLKRFDTNSDSIMSDQEIMKIVYPNGEPKPKPKPKAKAKPKAKPKGQKK